MKTDDLINALVADAAASNKSIGRTFAFALVAGAAISAALCLLWIRPRADFVVAATTVRFLFKFVVTSLLAVTALGLSMRLSRPGAPRGLWAVALSTAPALLAVAVAVEIFVVPSDRWATRLIGVNARYCLMLIPLLSIAPLSTLLLALREGAPTQPRIAGAAAGLAAGGIAATLYAAHCVDDSPLFVATWYSLAIGIVVIAGTLVAPRVLRW
jgi:hypothetical protein